MKNLTKENINIYGDSTQNYFKTQLISVNIAKAEMP